MDYLKNIPYKKVGDKYYLVNEELENFEKEIPLEPLSEGIFLGEDKKDVFYPSIGLLNLLKINKVVIDSKAEWLFLCGRDITFNHIVKKDEIKSIFLVQNEKEEILGLGKMKDNFIANVLDRGDFLRREN